MGRLRLRTPQYDTAEFRFIEAVNEGLLSLDPLLQQMPPRPTIHSGPSRNVRHPEIIDHPMQIHEHIISIGFDIIRSTDVDKFLEILWNFAEETKKGMASMIFDGLREVTDAIGNTVDGKGEAFSFDLMNEALEKISLSFDEEGRPIMPTLVVHPEVYKTIKDMRPTAEQIQRRREIIAAKKREHDAEIRTRRLS